MISYFHFKLRFNKCINDLNQKYGSDVSVQLSEEKYQVALLKWLIQFINIII